MLDDEADVIDLTGAADRRLAELSAHDAANSQVAVKEEKGSHTVPHRDARTSVNRVLAAHDAARVQQGSERAAHHVDGTGSWVVLFAFGLTVDFYGHKTV